MTILAFILTILVLVVIHELGHFLVAKKFGIKVEEFGFGLPPRIWGKKIGETIVSLNWLPFGGFVRLLGEDGDAKVEVNDSSRSFSARPVRERIGVVVAGVVMNLLLAWLLFYTVLFFQGFKAQLPLIIDHRFAFVEQINEAVIIVGSVSRGSPASQAGIKGGDRIAAINGVDVSSSTDLINETKSLAGKDMVLQISDPDKTSFKIVHLTPRVNPPKGQGALGISFGAFKAANLSYKTPAQKILAGPIESYNITAYSIEILGNTLGASFKTGNFSSVSQTVAGPVGVTSLVGDILSTKNPTLPFLDFLAALSLNLAIVNVLPFPGLDGGRLFFLMIEAVTRKRAHPTLERYVHTVGLVVLIGLIILVTISDIKKLI